MVEILPLRAVRFNSQKAGPIGPLLAPPYDVTVARANGVEFSVSGIENADVGGSGNQHFLAADRYRQWLDVGVLHLDELPAFYIHRHRFEVRGTPQVRTGIIARVRLSDWDERIVLPHERTNSAPREERRQRLEAVRANLSPLYFLFRDPDGSIREVIDTAIRGLASNVEWDLMEGSHELIPLTANDIQTRLARLFTQRTLFVADGHHRYEAALAYRDEQRRQHPGIDGPWEYVLGLLAAVEDTGVIVRPTHRLLSGGPAIHAGSLLQFVRRWFDVAEPGVLDSNRAQRETELFKLVFDDGKGPRGASPLPGSPHLALVAESRGGSRKALAEAAVEGVLQALGREDESSNMRRIEPVVNEEHVIQAVQTGEAHAGFLMPAPSLDRLLAVAEEGDLLPPKSTWFEPKAPAGLVINDLRRSGT